MRIERSASAKAIGLVLVIIGMTMTHAAPAAAADVAIPPPCETLLGNGDCAEAVIETASRALAAICTPRARAAASDPSVCGETPTEVAGEAAATVLGLVGDVCALAPSVALSSIAPRMSNPSICGQDADEILADAQRTLAVVLDLVTYTVSNACTYVPALSVTRASSDPRVCGIDVDVLVAQVQQQVAGLITGLPQNPDECKLPFLDPAEPDSVVTCLNAWIRDFAPACHGCPDPDQLLGDIATEAPELKTVDEVAAAIDIDRVVDSAAATFGTRYGGAWIDRLAVPPVLKVKVVNLTSSDASSIAGWGGYSPRVQALNTGYGHAQLVAWADVADDILYSHGVSPYFVHVDASRSKVLVMSPTLATDPNAQSSLAASIPSTALAIEYVPGMKFATLHNRRSNYPPYEAGIEWRKSNKLGTADCTAGFTFVSGSNYYGSTAGHCGNTGTPVWLGGKHPSDIGTNGYYGNNPVKADVSRYWIPASARTAAIFTGGGGHRTVKSSISHNGLTNGRMLCFQGAISGNDNCEVINYSEGRYVDGNKRFRPVWCIAFGGAPGDSGGPMYEVRRDGEANAAGGVFSLAHIKGWDGHSTCFASIPNMQAVLNANLLKG